MRKIAVVGGGSSGLFCSIYLKELLANQAEVYLLEKEEKLGKKILATGNGKCNLSNLNINSSFYNTNQVAYALRHFTPEMVRDTFARWGLFTRVDKEGRVYPYSEKATTVLQVLVNKANELGVKIVQFNVSHIKKLNHFLVYSNIYQLKNVDYLVLATGGLALVEKTNGYNIARELGHSITPPKAGLVAIKTKEKLKTLNGLRIKTLAKVFKDDKLIFSDSGEVLFRDDGISGILSFDLSRYLDDFTKTKIVLDLVSESDILALETFLNEDSKNLYGLLAYPLAKELELRYLKNPQKGLLWYLQNFELNPLGTYDYKFAQVTLGGVNINEINPTSFASIKTEGLYIIGEVLNVDGACGGYNLHFAWASAYLAAKAIKKSIEAKE